MKSIITLLLLAATATVMAQPQRQISFAQESKPHEYYVAQANLWWQEVKKDEKNEDAWYNYFRACRNAHGTADWRTDFVEDGPNLKLGKEIVSLMYDNIPNSFIYYYLSYLQNGIGTDYGDNLMKAYEMNPDFEGIHSSVISYAVSTLDKELRKRVNVDWYPTNYLSPQLLIYSYNVLMSLDSNAVLLTHNDNDSYPVWMLQDVLGIRQDVEVVNIDFMLLDNYRDYNLKLMHVKPQEIKAETKDVNIYEDNWTKIVKHILGNYGHERPLYIGMTTKPTLYEGYEDKMSVAGLALKFSQQEEDMTTLNRNLYEHVFLLDQLKQPLYTDLNQSLFNYHDLTYLNMLKILLDYYRRENILVRHQEVKDLAMKIAKKTGNKEYISLVTDEFK